MDQPVVVSPLVTRSTSLSRVIQQVEPMRMVKPPPELLQQPLRPCHFTPCYYFPPPRYFGHLLPFNPTRDKRKVGKYSIIPPLSSPSSFLSTTPHPIPFSLPSLVNDGKNIHKQRVEQHKRRKKLHTSISPVTLIFH